MAASNRCFTCEKAPGAYFCTGCKVYFCMKDLKNHHGQLLNDLDVLAEDRNGLQEKINQAIQQNPPPDRLLSQIDEWQKATIEKVKHAADQARQQVNTILNARRSVILSKFEKFSKDLIHLKETEEFVHDDLTRLQGMIQDLNQDLQQLAHPSSIELCTEESNQVVWNCLIYVEQTPTHTQNQQRFEERIG